MTHLDQPSWRRGLRIVVMAAAVAAAPLSCLAGETSSPAQPGPTLKTSIAKAVAVEARSARSGASMRATEQGGTTTTDLGSKSFFRSTAGIITLAVVAAGVGYALYSTSNDRVESPNRDFKGGRP